MPSYPGKKIMSLGLVLLVSCYQKVHVREKFEIGRSFPILDSAFRPWPMPDDLVKQSFYEDNPTYLSEAKIDDFWPKSAPEEQGLDSSVLQRGESELESRQAVFSYLVIRNNHLVMERYFHGSAVNHSNNIHSASKGILSALVGILLQKGYIPNLDIKIKDVLSGYQYPGQENADISLRNLLTMTAGFKWVEDSTEYEIENQKDWVQALVSLPLATKPGQTFHYSTGQSHLISAMIQVITGESLMKFGQENLFGPLGVTVEHWGKDPQGFQSGGYNFYMTPQALSRFASLFLKNGPFRDRSIIPSDWIQASISPQVQVDQQYSYGYYWWVADIGGHKAAKLWGYGGQFAYVFHDLNLIAIITSNTRGVFDEMDADQFMAEHLLPALKRR
jgi:CubicO group peptidase (beta-lactamase class C family)